MIKMKIKNDKDSRCSECNCQWRNTREMYTILISGEKMNLCKKCVDILFQKTLTASCRYNEKLKSKIDLQRAKNEDRIMMDKK